MLKPLFSILLIFFAFLFGTTFTPVLPIVDIAEVQAATPKKKSPAVKNRQPLKKTTASKKVKSKESANKSGVSGLSKRNRAKEAKNSKGVANRILPIKWSAQEKHFPGHNSFTPGRSTMTSDPARLAEKAGTGQQVGKIPVGYPGSKERVDFGRKIGTYIDRVGNASSTTKGIIHYSKDGIHIVPARP